MWSVGGKKTFCLSLPPFFFFFSHFEMTHKLRALSRLQKITANLWCVSARVAWVG